MQMKVSLHVFGSIRGYATLAKTDDITAEECVQLESFSFGQTGDSDYLDSLDKNPAVISRPLGLEHWAITRVLKGNPDDYERQTMLFVTAIISTHDWLDVLRCDVMPLLDFQQLWRFTPSEKLTPVNVNISSERPVPSSEIREKVISILCAIEKISSDEQVAILLDEKQYDIQVLRWLNMVLSRNYKTKFSYSVRSLSDGIDVDVISLSPIASVGNSTRKVTRFKEFPSIDNSIFASMVNKSWHKEGAPPWRFIDNCPSFNILQELPTTSEQTLISYHPKSIAQRSPVSHRYITLATKTFFVLLVMAIIGIACYFVISQIIVKKQVKQKIGVLIKNASTFVETHPDKDLSISIGQRDKLIADCRSLIFQIDGLTAVDANVQLIAERDKLQKWLDNATNFQLKYNALKQLIDECDNANLSKFPGIYPEPDHVQRRLDLSQRCTKILDDALSFRNDFEKITTNIGKINSWLSHIKKLIDDEYKNYKTETSRLPQKAPECFEEEVLKKYTDVQMKLAAIKKQNALINASNSPIENDKQLATKILFDINDINDKRIVPDIKKMNTLKEDSMTLCQDANSLIDKLNLDVNNINDVNKISKKISDVNEIGKKIKESMEKWPRNPQSGKLYERLNDKTYNLEKISFPNDMILEKKLEDLVKSIMNILRERGS